MNNCRYCNGETEKKYCNRECYELHSSLPTETYFADHLAYWRTRSVDFQEMSLKYSGTIDASLLNHVVKYNLPTTLRNREAPILIAVKMGCVLSDIDASLVGPDGEFDYRRLFRPVEGYELQLLNHKSESKMRPMSNVWGILSHIGYTRKEFVDLMRSTLNDLRESSRIKAQATPLQLAFQRLETNLRKLWKNVHCDDSLHWKDSVFKPASVAAWEVMLGKCMSSTHYTGAKVAQNIAEVVELLSGDKVDYRYLLDPLRPSDYISIKPKLRVDSSGFNS